MGVLTELPWGAQRIIGLIVVVVVVLIILFFKRLYDGAKKFIDWFLNLNLPKTISNFFKHPFGKHPLGL